MSRSFFRRENPIIRCAYFPSELIDLDVQGLGLIGTLTVPLEYMRIEVRTHQPSYGQPRPQGFSLIFWGKSPGDEVVLRGLHSGITTSTPLCSSGTVERVKYESTRGNRHPRGRSHAKGSEHLPSRVTFLTVAISTCTRVINSLYYAWGKWETARSLLSPCFSKVEASVSFLSLFGPHFLDA